MTRALALPMDTPVQAASQLLAVDRAVAELRRGGSVLIFSDKDGAALILGVETTDDGAVRRLLALSEAPPTLVLTAQRAAALGATPSGSAPVTFALPGKVSAATLRRLADPTAATAATDIAPIAGAAPFAVAAIELTKLARLLPAALIGTASQAAGSVRRFAERHDLLAVSAHAVQAYHELAARNLRIVAEADLPLEGAEKARIVAFRPSDGGIEHLAIVVGSPARDKPVLARLHSECFTGDLLGSLRCDCGEQLRDAIAAIARQGDGLLLYLAQEGRGIGLVNKLRAYRLQDSGADTIEANQQLGFEPDERIYLPAAEMLRLLGYSDVRLMTNNPAKVEGLRRCGITVVERVPHVAAANRHNDRYLETKAAKLGHLF